MSVKISFNQYKSLKKMTHNELNSWLVEFYKASYETGYNSDKKEEIDLKCVMVAVKATEGVGPKLYSRLDENINKLCYGDFGVKEEEK